MDRNLYSGRRSSQGLAVCVLGEGCGDGADREQREKGEGPMATAAIVPF